MDYKLIRSNRKTIAIHITKEATVEVRAPLRVSISIIEDFVKIKKSWIDINLIRMKELHLKVAFHLDENTLLFYKGQAYPVEFTNNTKKVVFENNKFILPNQGADEIKKTLTKWYKNSAKEFLTERTKHISDAVNIKFNQIKIGSANTRWGSCSTKNNINFTYKLLFLPPEIIDYVIVHELSHIIEHNHSSKFWLVVKKKMPDYKERQSQLKSFQKKITSYWY